MATKYTSPTWQNGTYPALSAANLQAMSDRIEANQVQIGTITLTGTWSESVNQYYYQYVTVSGVTVTPNSKIDLSFTADQAVGLYLRGIKAIGVENNNGTIMVYAVGSPQPNIPWTVQCAVTETV